MSSKSSSSKSVRCLIRSLPKASNRARPKHETRGARHVQHSGIRLGRNPMKTTQVLIAGGGPVGLMLAKVLADFGINAMVVERNSTLTRYPKMDITNGRSMELFRRFGLVDDLRKVAVPGHHPFDVSWITSLAGHE